MKKRNIFSVPVLLFLLLCYNLVYSQSYHEIAVLEGLNSPRMAFDANCNMYFALGGSGCNITKIDALTGTQSVYAGFSTGSTSDCGFDASGGLATTTHIGTCTSLVFDALGNLFMCDVDHNVVWMVDVSGNVHVVAGTGTAGYTNDGHLASTAELEYVSSIAVDPSENLYTPMLSV